ncbi:MAG: RNA methyltransferase [Oligosphaeraceae bacterium]|nr:RNA methyltransferase [Oligosphaeraceae bacterium]
MSEILINKSDRDQPLSTELLPVTLVLDCLRSAYNVGNIFRLAEATRVGKLLLCGYTAAPPHDKLAKTARGCEHKVPFEVFAEASEALLTLKRQGYRIYGVETAVQAKCYWEMQVRFPSAFVLGNEALGISEPALALCDEFVALPALGEKNSINVGNCCAVVLYEALRQKTLLCQPS